MTYNLFWSKITDILSNSLFGKLFLAVVRFFRDSFKSSWFYSFFSSHSMADYGENSKIFCGLRRLIFSSRLTEMLSDCTLVKCVCGLPQAILSSPLYILSLYILPCSVIMFARYFGNISLMVLFAVAIVFSIVIMSVRTTVGDMLSKSLLLGKICSYFLVKTSYRKNEHPKRLAAILFATGLIVGSASFVLGNTVSIAVFIGMLFLPVLIASPILLITLTLLSGMMFSTLPATALAFLTCFIVLCRILGGYEKPPRIRATYVLVLLYTLITAYYTINGFGGGDGVLAGAIQFIFLAFFFSIVTVINNFDKFKKILMAFSLSSVYTGLYGVYQFLTGQGGTGWANDEDYVGDLRRIGATFANPNVYGEFLIFTICIIVAAFFLHKKRYQRVILACCFALQCVNLILTYSRGCYLALMASLLIIVWCCDKRILGFAVFGLPVLPYVLPQNVITRLMSVASSMKDSSVNYRFSIWRGALRVIEHHWFVGSGIGAVAFNTFYQNYMIRDVTAQHSHNLLIQITIELSIVATIVMLLLLFFMIKDTCFTLKCNDSIQARLMIIPLVASFAGVMMEGLVDHIFYNNIVFLVFWTVLAFVVAGLNILTDEPKLFSVKE